MAYIMKDFSVRIKYGTMRDIEELYKLESMHRKVSFDVFCRRLIADAVIARLSVVRSTNTITKNKLI